MAEPSGPIIARPLVLRACGHQQEFQHYTIDRFRAQRLAKFQGSRCADCAAKLAEEEKRAAAARPKKGEVLKSIPAGAQLSLTRQPSGAWAGTLSADGIVAEMTGTVEAGPDSVVVALAKLWASKKNPAPSK